MALSKNNKVGNALKGLDDFEKVSLGPDEDKGDLEEIDLTEDNVSRAQANPSEALRNPVSQQEAEVTPGQRVEGTTPKGTSEAAEIEQTGKDMGKVGKALANPAVQKFLGQMGVAFARGNPNEPGAILGKQGMQQAEAQQVNNLSAKMLKGEEITEEDMRGVDNETFQQAREQSLAEREQARKEEATEADIEQGEEGLDLEQQRIDLQERAQSLRERGMELDEAKFDFNKEMSEEELLQAETELNIAEKRQQTESRIAVSQAKYYEARARALDREDEPTPKEQARLQEARNETSELISDRLDEERTRLETMESAVSSDNPNMGDFAKAFFQLSDTQRSAQLERELENNIPQARQAVKRQREFVNDLEEQLQNIQGNTEATGGDTQTGDDAETDTGGDDVVTVESQDDLDGLTPGTTVQNTNGVQGIVQEDGTIEW